MSNGFHPYILIIGAAALVAIVLLVIGWFTAKRRNPKDKNFPE